MATNRWISTSSGDWATGANWSTGSAPSTGDDVYFDATGSASVSSGLNQSAVTLASLNISSAYTGAIGTASAYLQVSATLLNIGAASRDGSTGQGSGRIKIDLGSNASTITIFSSSSSSTDTGKEPIRLIGSHASNALYVAGGRVGIAADPGESSMIPTVGVTGGGSTATLGSGCTLTTLNNNGGTLNVNSAATTLTCSSGTTTTLGTGAITMINADGGVLNLWHRASGVEATTLVLNGATVNFKGEPLSASFTNTTVKRGGNVQVFSASQVSWGTVTFDPTYQTNLQMIT